MPIAAMRKETQKCLIPDFSNLPFPLFFVQMQVLLLACLIGATSALFGEQLRRIALKELPSPMMAADAQFYNYKTDGKCNPNIGIAYTAKQVGTTPYTPLTYYYTARGQLSGIGMTLYDIPSNKSYVPQGFIDHNSVEVSHRMCVGACLLCVYVCV